MKLTVATRSFVIGLFSRKAPTETALGDLLWSYPRYDQVCSSLAAEIRDFSADTVRAFVFRLLQKIRKSCLQCTRGIPASEGHSSNPSDRLKPHWIIPSVSRGDDSADASLSPLCKCVLYVCGSSLCVISQLRLLQALVNGSLDI